MFPGSFDPLTVAHLAIAEAVVDQCAVVSVELVVSVDPLAKDAADQTPPHVRIDRVRTVAAARPWLTARTTEHRLLVDIADGYDVVVLGADKWHQLHDVAFYGSVDARDAALARLPRLAIAHRAGTAPLRLHDSPLDVVVLEIDPAHAVVSSTAVRAGRDEWRA